MSYLEKIKKLCKEQKKTIKSLEEYCGLSKGVAYKWRTSAPNVKTVAKIADFFDVPLDYFEDNNIKEEIDNEPKVFDIDKELNDLIRKINISDQIAFSGEAVPSELSDTSKTLFLMSIKTILEQQKHLAEQE